MALEISYVRNRLRAMLQASRQRAAERRQRVADAERAFDAFLELATPVVRQLATALKAEGHAFTVATPERALRLTADRHRDVFLELRLDTDVDPPEVMARISYTRGSRTIELERPVRPGASPDRISEDELLQFLLEAIEPMV